jgi:Protein of unknown function (DUF4031)
MIYVGTMEFQFGRMLMSHMATDDEIEELHKMADAIGVNRKWFQNKTTDRFTPHYDICKSMKAKAIKLGAKEINDRELINKCYPDLKKLL